MTDAATAAGVAGPNPVVPSHDLPAPSLRAVYADAGVSLLHSRATGAPAPLNLRRPGLQASRDRRPRGSPGPHDRLQCACATKGTGPGRHAFNLCLANDAFIPATPLHCIAIVAACVGLLFVSSACGALGQPRLAPSPVNPIDAVLVLLEGACLPLVGRKDLHLRLETDWLALSDWRSPAELSTRLVGRPSR